MRRLPLLIVAIKFVYLAAPTSGILLAAEQASGFTRENATVRSSATASAAALDNVNATNCDLLLHRPGVELYACEKIKIVYLTGKAEDRAKEFGRLLLEKRLDSQLIDYFANRLLSDIPESPGIFRALAEKFYNWFTNRYFEGTPEAWRNELRAVAAGAGLDSIYVERGALLADLANLLNSYANDWPLRTLPALGCTSVAKRTLEGGFFYGRNLDFSSGGIWDERPLVVVHIPAAGSKELRHIAFGSDGLPFAGITGVNEKGLSFAVHQNYSSVKSKGVPMLLLGEMLLREATDLAEAKRFLEKHRPGPLWTFVVTDLKSGEAMAVESSHESFQVRPMQGDVFVQTNHVIGSNMRALELIRPAIRSNSEYRFYEAGRLLANPQASKFDPVAIFRALAFASDPRGELNGYHDILKPHTIQSIVFERPTVWEAASVSISKDAAPTASGTFLKFRLRDLFYPEERNGTLAYSNSVGAAVDPMVRSEQVRNAEALREYFDLRQTAKALSRVAHQTSLGARLFQAVAHYELKEYARAAEVAENALAALEASSNAMRIRDGLIRVWMNALLAQDKTAEAKALAKSALERGTDTEELLETIRFVNENRALPRRLRVIHYDFFSGNLRTHPRASVP